jgi:hypothetical protein
MATGRPIPLEQWNVARQPSTHDDVSITKDGRRLDTADKVRAWIAEVNAERERERLSHAAQRSR